MTTIRRGDCVEVMRTLADSSVDAVVTDPPYELGFMGKRWDASGIAFNVPMWTEVLRVLKPGGLVLDPFAGSGSTGVAAALEGFGFLGIEREAAYVEIARRRIRTHTDKPARREPQAALL